MNQRIIVMKQYHINELLEQHIPIDIVTNIITPFIGKLTWCKQCNRMYKLKIGLCSQCRIDAHDRRQQESEKRRKEIIEFERLERLRKDFQMKYPYSLGHCNVSYLKF